MTAVNSTGNLSVTVGKFYRVLGLPVNDKPYFSLPTKDYTGTGTAASRVIMKICLVML